MCTSMRCGCRAHVRVQQHATHLNEIRAAHVSCCMDGFMCFLRAWSREMMHSRREMIWIVTFGTHTSHQICHRVPFCHPSFVIYSTETRSKNIGNWVRCDCIVCISVTPAKDKNLPSFRHHPIWKKKTYHNRIAASILQINVCRVRIRRKSLFLVICFDFTLIFIQ